MTADWDASWLPEFFNLVLLSFGCYVIRHQLYQEIRIIGNK